jgi:serine/threonine-protein phosphatase 2A activator
MLPASTQAPWAVEAVGEAAPVPEAVQGLMLAEARRAAAEASSGPLTKRITDQRSLQRWKKSEAHANILKYISELGDAVVGRRATQECEERPIISTIVAEFEAMRGWIDQIPPLQQSMRYGNKAFKTWHERLVERSHQMMLELFERHGPACVEDTALAAAELHTYFIESFGSPVRIDYGEREPACFAFTQKCPNG